MHIHYYHATHFPRNKNSNRNYGQYNEECPKDHPSLHRIVVRNRTRGCHRFSLVCPHVVQGDDTSRFLCTCELKFLVPKIRIGDSSIGRKRELTFGLPSRNLLTRKRRHDLLILNLLSLRLDRFHQLNRFQELTKTVLSIQRPARFLTNVLLDRCRMWRCPLTKQTLGIQCSRGICRQGTCEKSSLLS